MHFQEVHVHLTGCKQLIMEVAYELFAVQQMMCHSCNSTLSVALCSTIIMTHVDDVGLSQHRSVTAQHRVSHR